jgi:aminoglycoside phosphotransferase (APT) family kinase protein
MLEHAGIPSDSGSVGRIIESAFPPLRGMPVEFLGEGWDFRVFEVGGKWMFRFPKHEGSVAKLKMELALLPELNLLRKATDSSSLRIPDYEYYGISPGDLGWPFGGYRKLPGVASRASEEVDSQSVPRQLGSFLSWLHGYSIDRARHAGVPDMLDSVDYWHARSLGELETLSEDQVDTDEVRLFLEDHRPASFAGPMCMTHNDLFVEHVLLHPGTGAVSAIIDWSDTAISEPALDFAALYTWLGATGVQRVLASYSRPIDDDVLARARYLAACRALRDIAQGRDAARPDWAEVGFAGLRRALRGNGC